MEQTLAVATQTYLKQNSEEEVSAALATISASNPTHTCTRIDRQTLFRKAKDTQLSPGEINELKNKYTKPLELGTAEYDKYTEEFFKTIFKVDTESLEETTPHRIRCCWRIIREFARTKRMIGSDEPLISGIRSHMSASLDQWNMPSEIIALPDTVKYLTHPEAHTNPSLLQCFSDSLRLRQEFWPWVLNNQMHNQNTELNENAEYFDPEACPTPNDQGPSEQSEPIITRPGLSLLPPPVPLRHITEDGRVSDKYDPDNDVNLRLYLKALGTTAEYLGIYNGTEKDHTCGLRGMQGLINTNTVRLAFPTKMQMIAWEYILLNQTLHSLVRWGGKITYNTLLKKHGLFHTEAHGMIKMAKRFARDLCNADRAEDRAIMLLRCEELQRRAILALDFKTENNAMKQMSQILGLTRTEDEDTLQDFVAIAKRQTANRAMHTATIGGVGRVLPEIEAGEPDEDGEE